MKTLEIIFPVEKCLDDGRRINITQKILVPEDLIIKREINKIKFVDNGFLHTITNCIIR